jgi:hypothetical protein
MKKVFRSIVFVFVTFSVCACGDKLEGVTIEIPEEYNSIPYFYRIEFEENGVRHLHTRRESPHPGYTYNVPDFRIVNDTISYTWDLKHNNPVVYSGSDNIYDPVLLVSFQSSDGRIFIEGKEYNKKATFKDGNNTQTDKCVFFIQKGQGDVSYSITFNACTIHSYLKQQVPFNDTIYYNGRIDFSKRFVAWQESYEKQKGLNNNYREDYIVKK